MKKFLVRVVTLDGQILRSMIGVPAESRSVLIKKFEQYRDEKKSDDLGLIVPEDAAVLIDDYVLVAEGKSIRFDPKNL